MTAAALRRGEEGREVHALEIGPPGSTAEFQGGGGGRAGGFSR